MNNEARELAIKIVDAVQSEQCRLNKIDTVESALAAYTGYLSQQRDEWKERHRYRVQLYDNVMEILNEQRGCDLAQLTALTQERYARWIPVGERLPEERERVLIYVRSGETFAAYLEDGWFRFGMRGTLYLFQPIVDVTHWKSGAGAPVVEAQAPTKVTELAADAR